MGHRFDTLHAAVIAGALIAPASASAQTPPAPTSAGAASSSDQAPITVVGKRDALLGTAATASEGVVDDSELQLTPAYRPGQLLETVPGLIVTLHSGEGKANQFLLRGYNLDHGTDLETYVDGMPVNQPTHAHGQGYTDLNFLIPEMADAITYTKGPYYANVGDFGAVGSVRMGYRDTIDDQITLTGGSYGFERVLAAGSQAVGQGNLLAAVEAQHYDGPSLTHDNARKVNVVLRYSQGTVSDGFSLTGMFYRQNWTNTTDIPVRAISEGLVANRFGTLDPTDGGHATRASFSANYHVPVGDGEFSATAFYIYNKLHLINDFTHFLFDPVHGDQETQYENRHVIGGSVDYTRPVAIGAQGSELKIGGLVRYDILDVGRVPSQGQQPLSLADTAADPVSFNNHDKVLLLATAGYAQLTTHWTQALRTIVGGRIDFQDGTDNDLYAALHQTAGYTNGGHRSQALAQPKGSVIYAFSPQLEFYLSGGQGFHSADLRGVNQDRSVDLGLPNTPLLARQVGEEFGVRAAPLRNFTFTAAVFNLYQTSETIIDPDVGQDSAGPPSKRYGYEINVTYQIFKWLELYASFSGDHTRFTTDFDDGTGHVGRYITDAPKATGSFALYAKNLGPWSGGLQVRYLGNYPLSSGPCVDSAAIAVFGSSCAAAAASGATQVGQVNGKGFTQVNVDVHREFGSGWSAGVGIYNLFNTRAAAAEFYYVDRLQSEVAAYPNGRADIHEHPLEPIMARFTLSKHF